MSVEAVTYSALLAYRAEVQALRREALRAAVSMSGATAVSSLTGVARCGALAGDPRRDRARSEPS